MQVLSKELVFAIQEKSCQHMIHPWTPSCWKWFLNILVPSFLGVGEFFIVIYITKVLMQGRKMNVNYLKKQVRDFGWSYIYGMSVVSVLIRSLCLTRYLFEGFYYNFSVFIPGFLTGLSIFFETPKMKSIHAVTFTTAVLEAFVKYLTGEKLMKRTPVKDTLYFMFLNAFLMYFMKKYPQHCNGLLWFLKPSKSEEIHEKCARLDRIKRIFHDSMKYFWSGYAMSIGKILIYKWNLLLKNNNYTKFFRHFINKQGFKLGFFLFLYVFVYRIVMYELQYKRNGEENKYDCFIAGLLSGISYYFSRNLSIGVMPLTLILQILWRIFNKNGKFDKWKVHEIFYACLMATLLHFRIFLPAYCPNYFNNMLKTGTCGRSTILINHFNKTILEAQPKIL